jgi:hypothetical protein
MNRLLKVVACVSVAGMGLMFVGQAQAATVSAPIRCFQGDAGCPPETLAIATLFMEGETVDSFTVAAGKILFKIQTVADFGNGGPILFEYGIGTEIGQFFTGFGTEIASLTGPNVSLTSQGSANVAGANALGISIFEAFRADAPPPTNGISFPAMHAVLYDLAPGATFSNVSGNLFGNVVAQFGRCVGEESCEGVSLVPLPAAGWLFLSALGCLGVIGSRRRSAAT